MRSLLPCVQTHAILQQVLHRAPAAIAYQLQRPSSRVLSVATLRVGGFLLQPRPLWRSRRHAPAWLWGRVTCVQMR